jgi:hypothetical protein
VTDEPPLNLEHGFTVSVYFPPESDPAWVSDFLSRVAEDAHNMPHDSVDAFVVGHARDVLGIDDDSELTRGEALDLVDDLGQQAYRAEDRLAFIAEMCALADRNGEQVTTERVRSWLAYQGCGGAIVLPDDIQQQLGEALGHAMDAMKASAGPVFCHHPDARRTVHETHQAGWGRCAVVRLECPTCQAWAEQLNDEPILTPTLLNTARCTDACTEQHTYRPGCQIAPDWRKRP